MGTATAIPFGVGQQALAQSSSQNNALRGPIASVQLDENGEPSWIQSGIWVMRMLGSSAGNQTGSTGNQTGETVQFIARFAMVMPDGSAMHMHSIYGFEASDMTQEGNSTTIEGTATVTLRDGPVPDVPVRLEISNDTVMAIFISPDEVDAHFGDGPVYGLLSPFSRSIIQEELEGAEDEEETPPVTPPVTPPPTTNQTNTIELSAEEDGEDYVWSSDEGTNPTLEMVAGNETTIEIDNPTDEVHNLIIESDGEELEQSGDIEAGDSGELTITPEDEGTLDYHCEYHPDTMNGTIEVSASEEEDEETPSPTTNQTSTVEMTVEGDDEASFRWMADDELNPTLEMVAGNQTTIEIENPTEEVHNLVIESDGDELEQSGNIEAGEDGELTITPEEEGELDYYCIFHPETMVGTIEVSSST
ncbi:cupredoxin domain-containing protein [Candidatus Nitrososphaera sp. FF02]|uniref:cupredoxin domain-containing protein n=1 Tax=Candidatus Nitrososphaera sp. FF02 TaxID=3398226 RepID=UPI0039E75082